MKATVNRKRVQRMMRRMGTAALHPNPRYCPEFGDRSSKLGVDNGSHPHFNSQGDFISWQSWTGDSRKILARWHSNSMDDDFCVEALRDALAIHGSPETLSRKL